jgi:hypothetical protein
MASLLLNYDSEVSSISSSAGMAAFSGLADGRASSFQHLSVGEAETLLPVPAPVLVIVSMPKL